jgi:hypothetical protein
MSKFTVSWWITFFDHEPEIHYLVDEEFEAESLDEMYTILEEGVDNNEFEPEEKIPDNWDLGNLNLEYGIIRDEAGNILYKDEDLDEDKVPLENRL